MVHLGPEQKKELKALAIEQDVERSRVVANKDFYSLQDHSQYLFQASFIVFRLASLLHHLLAIDCTPALSEALLVKVLVRG